MLQRNVQLFKSELITRRPLILETNSLEPSSHFPLTKTLKSFVLQHNGNKNKIYRLDKQMKNSIQKIIRKSASNLRCFWTSIPSLDMDNMETFNWKKMIAWNHFEIPLNLPSIESCMSNLNLAVAR